MIIQHWAHKAYLREEVEIRTVLDEETGIARHSRILTLSKEIIEASKKEILILALMIS